MAKVMTRSELKSIFYVNSIFRLQNCSHIHEKTGYSLHSISLSFTLHFVVSFFKLQTLNNSIYIQYKITDNIFYNRIIEPQQFLKSRVEITKHPIYSTIIIS